MIILKLLFSFVLMFVLVALAFAGLLALFKGLGVWYENLIMEFITLSSILVLYSWNKKEFL